MTDWLKEFWRHFLLHGAFILGSLPAVLGMATVMSLRGVDEPDTVTMIVFLGFSMVLGRSQWKWAEKKLSAR